MALLQAVSTHVPPGPVTGCLLHGGHCSWCFGHMRNKTDKNCALEDLTFWQVYVRETHINKSHKEGGCINVLD